MFLDMETARNANKKKTTVFASVDMEPWTKLARPIGNCRKLSSGRSLKGDNATNKKNCISATIPMLLFSLEEKRWDHLSVASFKWIYAYYISFVVLFDIFLEHSVYTSVVWHDLRLFWDHQQWLQNTKPNSRTRGLPIHVTKHGLQKFQMILTRQGADGAWNALVLVV